MPSPPNLISPAPPTPPTGPVASVIVRLYIGLILVFLPWTAYWTYNRFFLYFAPVAKLVETGAFRGVASGLGLLNLWIAISEAIHYKEN